MIEAITKIHTTSSSVTFAMGHKPDDHEDEQTMDGMTMGGW